jgi:hypothetical protein
MPSREIFERMTQPWSGLPGRGLTLPEPARALLLGVVLIALGFGGLNAIRTTFTLDGRIQTVLPYPGLLGASFVVLVKADDGRTNDIRLAGPCPAAHWYGPCLKPEFPAGHRISLTISDFFNPALCPADAADSNCLPHLRPRWRVFQRVTAIAVDGREVASGWSSSLLFLWPYAWLAALIAIGVRHRWRLATVPLPALFVMVIFTTPLIVPLFTALSNLTR